MSEDRAPSRLVWLIALFGGLVMALVACGSNEVAAIRPAEGVALDATATEEPTSGDGGANAGAASQEASGRGLADQQAEPNPASGAGDAGGTGSATQPEPTPVVRPAAPNGRVAPAVATKPQNLAALLVTVNNTLRNPDASPAERASAGHAHQVAIRKLGYTPEWDEAVFAGLPPDISAETSMHITARRALIDLSSGYSAADFIPAWEIVEPEPAEWLMGYYREAEEATGIDWEYLAAINLIETGMGRIRGLSSAGAQGPMQFLPTTWTEQGIGEGDINDPHDAIHAAARYLVRRGGPADMDGAIWGYNNSDDYVFAVKTYAELLRINPDAYADIYNWEIYFFTEAGDIWLPTGFRSEESIDLSDFLAANPWSAPDAGLR